MPRGRFPLTLTTRVADAHMEAVHELAKLHGGRGVGDTVRAIIEDAARAGLPADVVAGLDFAERVDESATAAMHAAAREALDLDRGRQS